MILEKNKYILGPYNMKDLYEYDNYNDFIYQPGYLIYRIHNLVTDKSYIGDTDVHIYYRFYENGKFPTHYENYLNGCNKHLYNSMRKYGLNNFELGIIYLDKYDYDLEEKFIALYDSFYNGYNETINGKGFGPKCLEGRVWVHKTDELRLVKESELDYFYNLGFELGFTQAHNFNKTMVNNGTELKYVSDNELQDYINLGYELGAGDLNHTTQGYTCIHKDDINRVVSNESVSDFINEGWKLGKNYGANEGKISVVKDDIQYYIDPSELGHYIGLGFRRGLKLVPMEGRTRIEKDGEYKIVDIEGVNEYLDNGWTIWSSTRGLIKIYKDDELKYINPSELDKYESDGWTQGDPSILGFIRIINKSNERLVIYPSDENILYYAKQGYARGNKWITAQELWYYPEYKHLFTQELIDELTTSGMFDLE